MTLRGKSHMKKVNDTIVPAFQKRVSDLMGVPVQVEIDWSTCTEGDFLDHEYADQGFEKNSFKPLMMALEKLAADPFIKEHLQQSLKKIVVGYYGNHMYGKGHMKDGVFHFYSNVQANLGEYTEEISAYMFRVFNEAA